MPRTPIRVAKVLMLYFLSPSTSARSLVSAMTTAKTVTKTVMKLHAQAHAQIEFWAVLLIQQLCSCT